MNNLPGIVKVRKTSYYTQIHSHLIQNDLEDLRSIDLMSYVLSMDELEGTSLVSRCQRQAILWTFFAEICGKVLVSED